MRSTSRWIPRLTGWAVRRWTFPWQGTTRSAMASSSGHASIGTNEYGSVDHYFDEAVENARKGDPSKRAYTYLILGGSRVLIASAARVAVLKFISTMSASADVLALASLEVDLASIPVGSTITVKWRGKPVFIRHRTEKEIAIAQKDDTSDLKDPQKDEERVKNPDWLIVLGVCTHLGCVPVADAGAFKAWFCPCHGSHYDISGRIRKGPAPLNLEVPEYSFTDDGKVVIG